MDTVITIFHSVGSLPMPAAYALGAALALGAVVFIARTVTTTYPDEQPTSTHNRGRAAPGLNSTVKIKDVA